MQDEAHWSEVYRSKPSDSVSWYQSAPEPSLRALERFGLPAAASLVDVGGGASNLVDALIERGWSDLTVLDLAEPALEVARKRLGQPAAQVHWIAAGITTWLPDRTYDVWHDRAVFHFLTRAEERAGYRRALLAGVAPGGLIVMATFAPDGPERCSGLPVQRYGPDSLSRELGPACELVDAWREDHITPAGSAQAFNWCVFRRA
jgi:trans-aconitate methyltransferase